MKTKSLTKQIKRNEVDESSIRVTSKNEAQKSTIFK